MQREKVTLLLPKNIVNQTEALAREQGKTLSSFLSQYLEGLLPMEIARHQLTSRLKNRVEKDFSKSEEGATSTEMLMEFFVNDYYNKNQTREGNT